MKIDWLVSMDEEDICNLLLVNGNIYTVILTEELKQELNKLT